MQCKEFNLPLVAGGLLDQPEPLWTLVQTAGSTYTEYQRELERKAKEQASHDAHVGDAIAAALQALKDHGFNAP